MCHEIYFKCLLYLIYICRKSSILGEKRDVAIGSIRSLMLTPYIIIYFILLPLATVPCRHEASIYPKENDEAGFFLQVLLFLSLGIQNGKLI